MGVHEFTVKEFHSSNSIKVEEVGIICLKILFKFLK